MSGDNYGVVSKCLCPSCGDMIDCASGAYNDEATPHPGDVSICVKCGSFLRFTDDMKMRELTGDDLIDMDNNMLQVLINLHEAWKMMDAVRPKPPSERLT